MKMILRLQLQRGAEISMLLLTSLTPCTSIHSHPIQRFSQAGADPTHRLEASISINTSPILEMLRGNHCHNSLAFILAPCPKKSNPFESINSRFRRRLAIASQWGFDRDEAIHREAIVQHLANLRNIPVLGFRVVHHDDLSGVLLVPT